MHFFTTAMRSSVVVIPWQRSSVNIQSLELGTTTTSNVKLVIAIEADRVNSFDTVHK